MQLDCRKELLAVQKLVISRWVLGALSGSHSKSSTEQFVMKAFLQTRRFLMQQKIAKETTVRFILWDYSLTKGSMRQRIICTHFLSSQKNKSYKTFSSIYSLMEEMCRKRVRTNI